jgi:hypothetical protein
MNPMPVFQTQECIRVMCETEVLTENPIPVPLCPPQTPNGLSRIAHKPPQWETGDHLPKSRSSEGKQTQWGSLGTGYCKYCDTRGRKELNVKNCIIRIFMILTLHKMFLRWSRIRWTGHAARMEGEAKWIITAATEPSVNGDSGVEVMIILQHILEKQCVSVWTIHTVQDGNRWWILVNAMMMIQVS